MWWVVRVDPLSGHNERFALGIYGHPAPDELASAGIHSSPIKRTWSTEVAHFISSYAAKSALWLRRIPVIE